MTRANLTPQKLAARKVLGAAFRARLRALKMPMNRFAYLTGFPTGTVYSWTLQADSCAPPHPVALRLLRLIEIDPSTVETLGAVARESIGCGEEGTS